MGTHITETQSTLYSYFLLSRQTHDSRDAGKKTGSVSFFLREERLHKHTASISVPGVIGEVPKLVINMRIFFANQFLILSN